MEATPETLSNERAGGESPWAELVVQNGRLAGKRWPLQSPFVLIGQSEGCDVRLNVKEVSPHHCALIHTPQAPLLRDLQSETGTTLNGKSVRSCALNHGDILAVGPFRFCVELAPTASQTVSPASIDPELVRIQTAALVAQQTALTEEEIKLQQRRQALEQQEAQLAAHLDDKRRKLVELKQQLREASAALQRERKRHDDIVQETATRVEADRSAVEDWQRQAQTERNRLAKLRRNLKRRFHRHWATLRSGLAGREAELQAEFERCEKDREQLRKDREELFRARLRLNGEVELARRQIREEREEHAAHVARCQVEQAKARQENADRVLQLDEQEADLVDIRAGLAREQQQWEERRLRLEGETEGLEARIRNQRRKLIEQQRALAALQQRLDVEEEGNDQPVTAPVEVDPALVERDTLLGQAEKRVQEKLAALETQASELADQRLYLAEQCARLLEARQKWQQESAATAAQLEPLAHKLAEREQQLARRAHEIDAVHDAYQQRFQDLARQRQQLDGWQSRLAARTASWEGERQRFLAELKARERQADHALAELNQVRRRWQQRRRKEAQNVQTRLVACDKLIKESGNLRDAWKTRVKQFEQDLRKLGSRAMALEEYRIECLASAADREAGEQKLVKLRLRWAGEFASASNTLTKQHDEISAVGTRLEELVRTLRVEADRLQAEEAERSKEMTDADLAAHERDAERVRLDADLQRQRRDGQSFERQIAELNDEVERLARALIDSNEVPTTLPRAA